MKTLISCEFNMDTACVELPADFLSQQAIFLKNYRKIRILEVEKTKNL